MARSENKTKATVVDPAAFIEAVADPRQRADAQAISAMMARLSGAPPRMWGPSIIGFGAYHYRYESGREGSMCRVGFSPRKAEIVLYLVDGHDGHADLLARLGKHRIGKSCLYIKRLSDIDEGVLEAIVTQSLAHMAEKYPDS